MADFERSNDSTDTPTPEAGEQPKKPTPPTRKRRRNRRNVAIGVAASTLGGLGVAGMADRGVEPGQQLAMGGAEAKTDAVVRFVAPEKWDIERTKNDKVDFFIEFLMFDNRDKTKLWLERLGKYGPMLLEKLEERGMPQDLIWLATIESGLDPNAYSKADAAGLWQFIEETGRRHGLEISEYVDERRDPIAATDAALDYLQKLNSRFGGSWYLAAAGYNTGENRVERIVKQKAGGRFGDESVYWDISRHLPRETRDYVPVMLAMGHIGKDPAKYGFADLEMQEPLRFETKKVAGGTPLADVAKEIGVAPDVLYDLNAHLVKKMTPPGRDWDVRIPVQGGTGLA